MIVSPPPWRFAADEEVWPLPDEVARAMVAGISKALGTEPSVGAGAVFIGRRGERGGDAIPYVLYAPDGRGEGRNTFPSTIRARTRNMGQCVAVRWMQRECRVTT